MKQKTAQIQQSELASIVAEGIQSYRLANYEAAEAKFTHVLEHNPDHADALNLLGCVYESQGMLERAAVLMYRAIAANPVAYPYFYNLGNLLVKQGNLDEAVKQYETAIRLKPDYAIAHNNLGMALRKQGKRDASRQCFQKAIQVSPGYADAHYNLALEFRAIGQLLAAIEEYKKATSLQPKYADAWYALGNAYYFLSRIEEAGHAYTRALQIRPDDTKSLTNMGSVHMLMGRLHSGIACFQQAISIDPQATGTRSNLIMAASYSSDDPATTYRLGLEWDRSFVLPNRHAEAFTNVVDPERRLRVGYVSADLRRHAAAYWIEPLLEAHRHTDFEVYCYFNSDQPDDVTDRLRSYADHWVPCEGMSDDALAERVRRDEIDILVDFSGHTDQNRLPVFARQPAPLQVSWFGFPVTTGLKAIHYRLTDDVLDPLVRGNEHYSETLLRFDRFYAAYKPEPSTPIPGKGPVDKRGFITFASFNSYVKVTPEMLNLWGHLLKRVPNSRLLLQASGLGGPELAADIRSVFADLGIAATRIDIRGWTGLDEYLQLGQEVDIALDPYPFNGGVTTCHALWMGLPVVTLCGESAASRVGRSILSRMELSELVAESPNEYVEIAVALAKDLGKLAELRASLRERMGAAGLLDGQALAQQAEATYRKVWQTWCKGQDNARTLSLEASPDVQSSSQ
ncbi:MAG: tetratricopeptide repeat protein [Pseudomonadota bacterium]